MHGEDVTELLAAVRRGEPDAGVRLVEAVHAELRAMAEGKLRGERTGHTLQPTALVNEAYLRLRGGEGELDNRAHFFGAAARAMERVLVDHARRRSAQKRGGGASRVSFADVDVDVASPAGDLDVFELHEAVAALEAEDEALAALVRYRYFLGLTVPQIAELEGVSPATVKRRWTYARAWLFDRLGG